MDNLSARLFEINARVTTLINVPLMLSGSVNVSPDLRTLVEDNATDICQIFGIETEELEEDDDIIHLVKRHVAASQLPVHEWLAEVDIMRPHNLSIAEDGSFNFSHYGWGSYETIFVAAGNLNALVSMIEVCKANMYIEIYEQEQSN